MVELAILLVSDGRSIQSLCKWYCYELPDNLITYYCEQDVAWCYRCEAYVLAERLPTLSEIQNEIDRLEALRPRWNELDAEFAKRINSISERYRHENQLKEWLAILAWRTNRKSPAKCLSCGSITGFRVIAESEEFEDPLGRGKVRIGNDPYCAGVLVNRGPPCQIDAEGNVQLISEYGFPVRLSRRD